MPRPQAGRPRAGIRAARFLPMPCMANRPEHVLCVRAYLQPIPFGTPCRNPYRAIERRCFLTSMRRSTASPVAPILVVAATSAKIGLSAFPSIIPGAMNLSSKKTFLASGSGVRLKILVQALVSWSLRRGTFLPAAAVRRTGLKKGFPPAPSSKDFWLPCRPACADLPVRTRRQARAGRAAKAEKFLKGGVEGNSLQRVSLPPSLLESASNSPACACLPQAGGHADRRCDAVHAQPLSPQKTRKTRKFYLHPPGRARCLLSLNQAAGAV